MNQFNPEFLPPRSTGKPAQLYSTSLPFVIVLVTLIFSTSKDIFILHKRKNNLLIENSRQAEPLDKAGREAQFVERLHQDLEKLAPTDPTAGRILAEFFSPPKPDDSPIDTPAAPKPPSQ